MTRCHQTQRFNPPLVCGLIAGLCGLAWLAGGASAQPMADQLPAATLLYSGWSPNAALQDTMAARMLADERVVAPWKTLVATAMRSMPGEVKDGGAVADHLPKLLADAGQCEGCFALLELKKGEKGRLDPQAILILNLGAKKADFEAHFKPIHNALKEALGDSVHLLKIEKSWLWSKSVHEHDEYFWGFVGDRFVIYYGDGGEAFLSAMASGRPEKSLAAAPGFTDCLGKIPGDSVMTTYIDAPPLLAMLRGLLQEDNSLIDLTDNWQKLLVQVGLDNIKSVGEKTSIQDQQFVTRTLLRTDGAPHGLLTALLQPGVDNAMFKCVPPDAMAAFSMRLDLGKTYDQLKTAAIAIGDKDARKTFSDFEQQAKEAGMPVQEVLAPLGDQWVVYSAGSTGGMFLTGWTLVGTLKDAKGFDQQVGLLSKLFLGEAGKEGVRARQYVVDDVTIHYLEFGGMFEFFTPAWAASGDKLVIAFFPQIVEDAVRQLSADKSLLDNPDFKASRKLAGHDGPSIYLAGPEIVRNFYPLFVIYAQFARAMATSFGPGGAGTAANAPAELIPSMQRLLRYVGGDCVSVKLTPDGIVRTKSVANPLLSPFTLTDNIPLLVALALPSLHQAQESGNRVKSGSNLRQIGQGLILYANDNKGAYPPDFATLRKTQDLTDDNFKSPDGHAKNGPDYVYLVYPGMKNDVAADLAIAYDAAELEAGEGANLLFGDGHVEYLDASGVNAAIEKAKKAHPDIVEPAKQKNGGKVGDTGPGALDLRPQDGPAPTVQDVKPAPGPQPAPQK